MIIATLGEDISAVSVGAVTVELEGGALGCSVAGAAFVLLASSPFRMDFGFSSLFVSAKLFFCFLLGKHMGKNGRGELALSCA